MNIRISIKDSDQPAVITKNTLSQVQHKKKNMLYSPPQKDHSKTKSTLNAKNDKKNPTRPQKQASLESTQNQRIMMQQLDAASRNQVSLDMVNNSNRILQRQNQILQDNQRTLHQMVKKKSETSNSGNQREQAATRTAMVQALQKVTKDVQQMQKIRNQIVKVGQDVRRTFDQMKNGGQGVPRMPQQISQMNNNLRNLTQASQNHLQGLQNLEALKNLQNFNVNAYVQSVDKLKRQIIQYQKQSQAIQKQLRSRAAKLEKLQIPKNFEDQLIEPYHKYLQGKTKNVNLLAIREQVYQRIGLFDYGRFENDICDIMNQVKGCMSDFKITCKQYQIDVPTVKIDMKQLKSLDIKMPSILDDYKASRGINFKENANRQSNKINSSQGIQEKAAKKENSAGKTTKNDKNKLKNMITKPIDMATNIKYTRKDKQQNATILRTDQQKQRQDLKERMKKPIKNKQQDQFGKYLQNRAREELQSLYQQKRDQLRKMEKQLYEQYQQPVHIILNLEQRNKFERQAIPKQKDMQQKRRKSAEKQRKIQQKQESQSKQQYDDDFEDAEQSRKNSPKKQKPNQHGFKKQNSRQKSKEALKDRLKQLLNKQEKIIPRPNQIVQGNMIAQPNSFGIGKPANSGNESIGNLAEGLVALINNTLTQVNANLSKNIEKRISSRERPNEQARKHSKSPPRRVNIPKLQEFRPPPTFNINVNTNSNMHIIQTRKPAVAQQKIIAKNYDHLKVEDNQDLYVSDFSKEDDY